MSWITDLFDSIFGEKKSTVQVSPPPEPPIQATTPEAPVQDVLPEVPTPLKKKVPARTFVADLLVCFAEGTYPTRVGPYKKIKESKGKNRSAEIDAINIKQGGYLGAPYCQAGVQEGLDDLCAYLKIDRKLVKLPEGVGTQKVWADTPAKYKINRPLPATWANWNSGGGKGHTGWVISILNEKQFKTMEFNTSAAGQGIERDGEGFYNGLTRNIGGYGTTRVNGYIDVYAALADAMISTGEWES